VLILPLVLLLVVVLAALGCERSLRESTLAGITAISLATLVLTQVLSTLGALQHGWLVAGWTLLLAMLAVLLRSRVAAGYRRLRTNFLPTWGAWEWLTAAILTVIILGTLASALLYPIVNSDSLSYHMPRVFFWYQNHSVARYATPEGRQIFASPFAEYAILQAKILAGGTDRLSNTIQWLAYVLSILAVSMIAQRLGADRRGQLVASIAAAATPMAILQASTTQNDLVCAFWCLAAIYWVVSYVDERPEGRGAVWWWTIWLGSSLALAILTKPTAYLACAPFLLWLAIVAVRRDGLGRAAAVGSAVVLVTSALASGWLVENARLLDGDAIGFSAPGGNAGLLVIDRSSSALVANALKNTSMMLSTPSDRANDMIASGFRVLIRSYGGDPENPGTLDRNMPGPYALDHRITYHDVGPSPITLLLVAAAAIVLLLDRNRATVRAKWYLLCGAAALFISAGLIGYSYYINRVLLGCLLLLVPLVGPAFSRLELDRRRAAVGLMLGLLAACVAWGAAVMSLNATNRLLPPALTPVRIGSRDLGYWNTPYADLSFREHAPWLELPYKEIAAAIREGGYTRVGIDSKALNVTIYPLLALLSDRQVEYVGDTLLQGKLQAAQFSPQVVVSIIPADAALETSSGIAARGKSLYGPVTAGDLVLGLYRVP